MQIYALLQANKKTIKFKQIRTKGRDGMLDHFISDLVDAHTRKNMDFSSWKEFKKMKSLGAKSNSSESSFDS